MYKGKKILLAVSGGIAAYKCGELVRFWLKAGAEVRVVMTEAATRFITPLTMETLTRRPVHTDLFPEREFSATLHVNLADWADVVVAAPATANIIAKMAQGIADDFVSTMLCAAHKKTVVAPAMNSNMWLNPAVQHNIQLLRDRNYTIVEPEEGFLAEGYDGVGRLAAMESIDHWTRYFLQAEKKLQGKQVLVTGGRTEESIDPVRIITNRSSGKMGLALARAAFYHGADVTLVTGPGTLPDLPGIEIVRVTTALEMQAAVNERYNNCDIFIASAAVSDYRPAETHDHKLKKAGNGLTIGLQANPDILASLAQKKENRIHVGFAVETQNEKKNALDKLKRKNLDLVVMNNPLQKGAAFSQDTNKVILYSKKSEDDLPMMSKDELALKIMARIATLLENR